MDSLFDLISIVLKFALLGGFFLIALKFMKVQKSSNLKSKIQILQARLSKARMALKAKVKKKSNVLRSSFSTAILEGDPVDLLLKQLTENNFESGSHFQDYFDKSRQLISMVNADPKNQDQSVAPRVENDFMCQDFKTEMDIVRIIKEMATTSKKINDIIEENNAKHPNNALEKVDSLTFPAMADVNRIFKVDPGESSESDFSASAEEGSKKAS